MEKKTKLLVYLIKSEITDYKQIVESTNVYTKHLENGIIYYNFKEEHKPSWADSFFVGFDTDNFTLSSVRLILIKKIKIDNETRIFALSFGQSKFMFKSDIFEEQFGLKIVLNTLKINQIRKIAKKSVGGNQKSAHEQLPKGSQITDFGFDIQRDMVTEICGKNDSDETVFGKRIITGSTSLSITTTYNLTNIDEFLIKCYQRYKLTKYKSNFGWLDNIRCVNNKLLKDNLDNELIKQIKARNQNIWMAVPDVIEWNAIKEFEYSGERKNKYSDINIDDVIKTIKNELTEIKQLQNKEIRAISNDNENNFIYRWSAYECLVGNIEFNGNEYCISNGKWYQINKDFVSEINEKYNLIPISAIQFPNYNHENEDKYNEELCKSLKQSLLMHRQNISTGRRGESIEPCDVFWNNKIIHIKKNGGSSLLSHLFMQAYNSTIIWNTSSGREKIKKKVKGINLSNFNSSNYEVVIAIIGSKEGSRPAIPFFSKVTACQILDDINSRGFGVSIASINDKKIIIENT